MQVYTLLNAAGTSTIPSEGRSEDPYLVASTDRIVNHADYIRRKMESQCQTFNLSPTLGDSRGVAVRFVEGHAEELSEVMRIIGAVAEGRAVTAADATTADHCPPSVRVKFVVTSR